MRASAVDQNCVIYGHTVVLVPAHDQYLLTGLLCTSLACQPALDLLKGGCNALLECCA
jgi:hypothetical protein